MKHRVIFEPSDFKSSGQLVTRLPKILTTDNEFSYGTTVTYKIGYLPGRASKDGGHHIMQISINDGLCIQHDSIEDLCRYLNEDKQGFRPLEPDEIPLLFSAVGNRFE